MATEPPAPDDVPQYIIDGIDRQNKDTLLTIEQYTQKRREYLLAEEARDLSQDELSDEEEEVVEMEQTSKGTRVIKKVPCGKNCGGCPHGPYEYRVQRHEGDLEWTYVGPAEQR